MLQVLQDAREERDIDRPSCGGLIDRLEEAQSVILKFFLAAFDELRLFDD
jgi:hypothetical protein